MDEVVTLPLSQPGPEPAQTGQSQAIVTAKLTKEYGTSRGIIDLDLSVATGEIFGFLGPNGAGKSTTIRILLNLIKPSSGSATLLGLDSQLDSLKVRREVGYLPGEFSLYPNLTGRQTFEYFANLRDVANPQTRAYTLQLAERLELDLGKKFKQYSRGNKQKVGIIQAMMHRPHLLILDEPTSGLDPLNQQEFLKMIREAREAGATVFFSSHIMSEVEKTCDRVGIIREGRLVKQGNMSELTDLKTHQLELSFAQPVPLEAFSSLSGLEKLEEVPSTTGQTLHMVVHAEALESVVKVAARYPLTNFISREPSLEESFLGFYREPGK